MSKERALAFPVTLKWEDDAVVVTTPDLPEVATFGEDEADALLRARDAIEEALAARIANREEIPSPSSSSGMSAVTLDTNATLKVLLYRTMRKQGLRKADLARRLGWHGPQVDRLLDLNHSTRIDLLDQAFAALNRRVLVAIEDAA